MERDHRREEVGKRGESQRARRPAPRSEHAVLALQRAVGNQATARLLQRKIGFEFEMDMLLSAQATPVTAKEKKEFASQVEMAGSGKHISKDFTKNTDKQLRDYLGTGRLVDSKGQQREGKTETGGPAPLDDAPPEFLGDANDPFRLHALRKKDVIVRRPGYTLEADEGNVMPDGALQGKAMSNTEFVTSAFEENAQGRQALENSLQDFLKVTAEIAKLAGQGRRIVHASEVAPGGGLVGKVLLATAALQGALQVTGGIDMARVGNLMQGMNADTEESPQSRSARSEERFKLGNPLGFEGGTIGSAPRRAEEGIQIAVNQWNGQALPDDFGSEELKSFVALVAAYMTAAAGASIGYAKTIAPLMARTDFATMLKLTPECEFLSINSELLRAIVISTTGLGMNEPLFPNGIYRDSRSRGSGNPDALAGLTRRRWLQGIAVDEVDYLTAAEFNSNPDLNVTDPDAPKSDLESMGARGTTTEAVGPNAKQAPIFEIRSLGQVANPKAFSERALWIFDYLAQINQ